MVRVDVKSFYTPGQSFNDQQKKQSAFTIAHHAWEDELLDVLTDLQNAKAIDIQPVSPMMELKWSDMSGSKDKSTEIHLPLKEKAKGKRLGLYRFSKDGDVQFVSRNLSSNASEAVFRSEGTGKYIVMEYNVDYPDMKNHWASSTIGDLAAQHLFQEMVEEPLRSEEGQEGQGFKPNKAITRAEFAALLARAAGVSPSDGRKFIDVVDTAWYADELAAAVAAGIVQGVGGEKFNPDGLVTREQMAAMLMRAWSVQHSEPLTANPSLPFQDAKAMGAWSKPFISDAVSLGLLKGRANQMFVPAGTTSRAEAAQAIYNLMFSRN